MRAVSETTWGAMLGAGADEGLKVSGKDIAHIREQRRGPEKVAGKPRICPVEEPTFRCLLECMADQPAQPGKSYNPGQLSQDSGPFPSPCPGPAGARSSRKGGRGLGEEQNPPLLVVVPEPHRLAVS